MSVASCWVKGTRGRCCNWLVPAVNSSVKLWMLDASSLCVTKHVIFCYLIEGRLLSFGGTAALCFVAHACVHCRHFSRVVYQARRLRAQVRTSPRDMSRFLARSVVSLPPVIHPLYANYHPNPITHEPFVPANSFSPQIYDEKSRSPATQPPRTITSKPSGSATSNGSRTTPSRPPSAKSAPHSAAC